jgi:hypothetical protein
MKEPLRSSALRIADSHQAAAFANPLRRKLLLSLTAREASLADVARLMRVDLRRVHHHATALCALGLLTVVRERARAGRAIKMYRAVARSFFVPQDLVPAEPASPLAVEMELSAARIRAATRSGVLYDVDESGAPRMRAVSRPNADAVPAVEIWKVLRLSRSDALGLRDELANCLRNYAERENERGETYLLHCALAPKRRTKRALRYQL